MIKKEACYFLSSPAARFLAAYGAASILVPPIKIHGKDIFLAEVFLVPLFVYVLLKFLKKPEWKVEPNLLLLVFAVLISFLSGLYREQTANDITVYNWGNFDDGFSLGKDGIKALHWLGMFATPLFVWRAFRLVEDRDKLLTVFLDWVIFFSAISGFLAIVDHYGLIKLSNIYASAKYSNWEGRAFGTFVSPLEASLVYASTFCSAAQRSFAEREFRWLRILYLPILGYALILTQSATALIGVVLGIGFIFYQRLPRTLRKHVLIFIALLILLFAVTLPPGWLSVKIGNFSVRLLMWTKWVTHIPSHPWFAITGMGFTSLVVDNSFILLLVYGGLVLFIFFFKWFFNVLRNMNYDPLCPYLIIWIFSWLTLDSLGYWGLGRICWFASGLAMINPKKHLFKSY